MDLFGLLSAGESARLEFKESLDEAAMETISAFANTSGGILLIGVNDKGEAKGTSLGPESTAGWANRIAQSTRIHPEITVLEYEEKTIVAIRIDESPVKPVPYRGRYFKRVDRATRQMTDDDITRAVLERLDLAWDEIAESRSDLSDIDEATFGRFRKLCNRKGRRPVPDEDSTEAALRKLGLMEDGHLLRATILLFGREPQRFYPSSIIKVGRFSGPEVITDDLEIRGNILGAVETVLAYFRQNLSTGFGLEGGAARNVSWEYPMEALREAIINSASHRDYSDMGVIQVRWHDDRLVILNPGGLLPPLTVESLKEEHVSRPRNRKLAEMLFYAGWVERWGSGTLRMYGECQKARLPEPVFEEKLGGLWLTFGRLSLNENWLRSIGLNARQIQAVLHVGKTASISNTEYRTLTGASRETAKRDLADLVARRILARKGQKRGFRYFMGH